MEECTHNCESCNIDCKERSFLVAGNKLSHVKHVIGVVSGKGGVGKSLVTSLLAVNTVKRNKSVAILDADITGPSIPKVFGLNTQAMANDEVIFPVETKDNIKVMSINLLLDGEDKPVVWRGPVIAGAVKQFWTDVMWGEVDYMYVDMPPGTGDVPLTVFQSLPVDGIVVVTSPQDLVSMIVTKAVNMAKMMNIPILGIVENMSYFTCPNCNEKHYIFGQSDIVNVAKSLSIDTVSKLPILPSIASQCDAGLVEDIDVSELDNMVDKILSIKK